MSRLEELKAKYDQSHLPLDPKPWTCICGCHSRLDLGPEFDAAPEIPFEPRQGYSQNRSEYGSRANQ